jgi:hypothetical protein
VTSTSHRRFRPCCPPSPAVPCTPSTHNRLSPSRSPPSRRRYAGQCATRPAGLGGM